MDISIGEYLRLGNGHIYKWEYNDYEYIKWDEEDKTYVYGNGVNEYEWESDILEHSFYPIDLVKKGDYVNGYKVEDIEIIGGEKYIVITINETEYLKNKDIQSIMTKEMFESHLYLLEKEVS